MVAQMTVEEKVNITRGFPGTCVGNTGEVPRLGVPALCFADGPDGIRGQEFVSAFPAGIHLAATFDRDLMLQYGRALGAEYYGKGINVALGPVAGPLGRVARGGRNWEGLSNDPYLAGAGMGAITRGIQDAGVIATPKHWLLNEQEFRRRWSPLGEAISSNVDDRTLHELYAFPFMDALREGAGAVMCSYQRANHSYACQNSKLLNGILKTELGFEGFVVSDWDGQMSGVASANAGLDLVMPNAGFWGTNLLEAVNNGSVSAARITDMATRVLASWYYLHQQNAYPQPAIYTNLETHFPVDVQADHAKLIEEIGAAGTVLVKNVNNTLPLKHPRFLCVFGYDAAVKSSPWQNRDRYGGGYEDNFGWNTFNGTLITAGGSGSTTPPYVISPFEAIQERVRRDRGVLRWDFYSGDPTMYLNAEACLVFVNAYASESFDRPSLEDGFSDRLVLNVASWCANTIVVVHSAGKISPFPSVPPKANPPQRYPHSRRLHHPPQRNRRPLRRPTRARIRPRPHLHPLRRHQPYGPPPLHRRPLRIRLRRPPQLLRPAGPIPRIKLHRGTLHRLQVLRQTQHYPALRVRLWPVVHHIRLLKPLCLPPPDCRHHRIPQPVCPNHPRRAPLLMGSPRNGEMHNHQHRPRRRCRGGTAVPRRARGRGGLPGEAVEGV